MKTTELPGIRPTREAMERAFHIKDETFDGVFYVAVRTTGIFCRPSCPSRPQLENVEFLATTRECLTAGYRPCRRCHPLEASGTPPPWAANLMARMEAEPGTRLGGPELRSLGVSPERARRWFLENYGMTFTAWCRSRRLATAFQRIRSGESVDDIALDSGFESHSGFRDAYTRTFGEPPGRSRHSGERIVTDLVESQLGPILVGTRDEGICLVEFADRGSPEKHFGSLRRLFNCPVVAGRHARLDQLREELSHYFDGQLRQFTVSISPRGTPFQERVWSELCRIPHGATISYDELARRIQQPTAMRAVARANGTNRISILIPCHRVIGKDGSLTGYGGGLWRKRLLLELERTGRLPGAGTDDGARTAGRPCVAP